MLPEFRVRWLKRKSRRCVELERMIHEPLTNVIDAPVLMISETMTAGGEEVQDEDVAGAVDEEEADLMMTEDLAIRVGAVGVAGPAAA
jgi:hypothetical protein